ncbi:MAG: phosphotransferase [Chloroflexi bacterium]|nr:phosphotransferase [Chloroflexota bacterium]
MVLERTRRELLAAGSSHIHYLDLVYGQVENLSGYLAAAETAAFLYDLNVRNVLVNNGRVTGVIDVDETWYGDPLLAIGRGKCILLTMREDTDFITHWSQFLKLSDNQLTAVDFYALLYSFRFMGTLGQTLNGNYSLQTDPRTAPILTVIADKLLERLKD